MVETEEILIMLVVIEFDIHANIGNIILEENMGHDCISLP